MKIYRPLTEPMDAIAATRLFTNIDLTLIVVASQAWPGLVPIIVVVVVELT